MDISKLRDNSFYYIKLEKTLLNNGEAYFKIVEIKDTRPRELDYEILTGKIIKQIAYEQVQVGQHAVLSDGKNAQKKNIITPNFAPPKLRLKGGSLLPRPFCAIESNDLLSYMP